MKIDKIGYEPGNIVTLVGTKFVVLDVECCGSLPDILFLLTLESVGDSVFGISNNYAESDLKKAVDKWLENMDKKGLDNAKLVPREIDLTTLDGSGCYGKLSVKAAPLTLDEAREYTNIIPDADEDCWLATGWSGPDKEDRNCAMCINTKGGWDECGCANSLGIRPALKVSTVIFDGDNKRKPDLSEFTIDVLLEEISKRLKREKENVK